MHHRRLEKVVLCACFVAVLLMHCLLRPISVAPPMKKRRCNKRRSSLLRSQGCELELHCADCGGWFAVCGLWWMARSSGDNRAMFSQGRAPITPRKVTMFTHCYWCVKPRTMCVQCIFTDINWSASMCA